LSKGTPGTVHRAQQIGWMLGTGQAPSFVGTDLVLRPIHTTDSNLLTDKKIMRTRPGWETLGPVLYFWIPYSSTLSHYPE